MNRFDFPDLGMGAGLRSTHFPFLTAHWPSVDWFEIISENYIETEGKPLWYLDQFRERYPVVMHGVGMSVGSTDPIDRSYLSRLAGLAQRLDTPWLGDHLCWTGVNGHVGHDLYPIPYNGVTLRHTADRIRRIQDELERPIVLENPSTYATFKDSDIPEAEFIAALAEAADCALLLDVNNVYVTCRNNDLDAEAYLDALPLDRVVQIHLAGHSDFGTHCIDTHSDFVCDPVWALYERVIRAGGSKATLLEWDDEIPEFPVLLAELDKARAIRDRALAQREAADG